MKTIWKQNKHFKLTLLIAVLTISISNLAAQAIPNKPIEQHGHQSKKNTGNLIDKQSKQFNILAAQANVTFIFPKEFKEIKAPDDEDLSFDYGIELPGKEFEIWFQIKPQKENWASYVKAKSNNAVQLDNPDSLYTSIAAAEALTFTGEKNYLVRDIPRDYLSRYNADAGKSYLLTLLDTKATKHYKYALLFALQKFHTGIIIAVCFTNDKGPEFFKNINKAASALKFNPQG
jgi:hypothetical protein